MPRRKVVIAGIAFAGIAMAVSSAMAHDAITLRRKIMKAVGTAAKEASEMTKGQRPFDAVRAATHMNLIARAWPEVVHLFPKGSETGGRTRAAAEIWKSFAEFETEGRKMASDAALAADAATQGLEAFKVAFEPVALSCKSCHVTYMTRD